MNKLDIARKVATHPAMVTLTGKRDRMFKRMRSEYGKDFMGLVYADVPADRAGKEEMERTEMNSAQEGVNRWTRPERSQYLTYERRILNLREALTAHYSKSDKSDA